MMAEVATERVAIVEARVVVETRVIAGTVAVAVAMTAAETAAETGVENHYADDGDGDDEDDCRFNSEDVADISMDAIGDECDAFGWSGGEGGTGFARDLENNADDSFDKHDGKE